MEWKFKSQISGSHRKKKLLEEHRKKFCQNKVMEVYHFLPVLSAILGNRSVSKSSIK